LPEWLSLPVDQLGTSLDDRCRDQPPFRGTFACLLACDESAGTTDSRPADHDRFLVKVEDPLGTRVLLGVPALPPITNNDVLKRTVVARVSQR
jgi:hypothetical protein